MGIGWWITPVKFLFWCSIVAGAQRSRPVSPPSPDVMAIGGPNTAIGNLQVLQRRGDKPDTNTITKADREALRKALDAIDAGRLRVDRPMDELDTISEADRNAIVTSMQQRFAELDRVRRGPSSSPTIRNGFVAKPWKHKPLKINDQPYPSTYPGASNDETVKSLRDKLANMDGGRRANTYPGVDTAVMTQSPTDELPKLDSPQRPEVDTNAVVKSLKDKIAKVDEKPPPMPTFTRPADRSANFRFDNRGGSSSSSASLSSSSGSSSPSDAGSSVRTLCPGKSEFVGRYCIAVGESRMWKDLCFEIPKPLTSYEDCIPDDALQYPVMYGACPEGHLCLQDQNPMGTKASIDCVPRMMKAPDNYIGETQYGYRILPPAETDEELRERGVVITVLGSMGRGTVSGAVCK